MRRLLNFAAILGVALSGVPAASYAELSPEERAGLLSFYPCAAALNDDELFYLGEWANAVKRDPCGMSAQEFASTFISAASDASIAPIAHIESYFRSQNKSVLFVQQVLVLGRDDADGLWGPTTAGRFAQLVETYHAIGGIDDEWGVRSPDDVPRFLAWVAAAEYAEAVGGEFPD